MPSLSYSRWSDRLSMPLLLIVATAAGGAKTAWTFLIWGALALVVSIAALSRHDAPVSGRELCPFVVALVVICASHFWSQDPSNSLFWTGQALVFILLSWAVRKAPAFVQDPVALYMTLGGLAVVSALVSIAEYISPVRDSWRQACGLFPINPVFNAAWMMSVGLALLALHLERKDLGASKAAQWLGRAAFPTGIFLLTTAAAGPLRSALPALGFGLVFTYRRQITAKMVIAFLAFVLVAWLALPQKTVAARLRLNEGNYRSRIWTIAFKACRDHPFVGWGRGNFEMAYERYAFPVESDSIRFARTTQFAHSDWIQCATDMGVAAFLLMLWLLGRIMTSPVVRPSRDAPAKAGLFVLFFVAATNIIWHLPILLFLTLVWSAAVLSGHWKGASESRVRPAAVGATFTVIAVFIMTVLVRVALRDHWKRHAEWARALKADPQDAQAWRGWAEEQTSVTEALRGFSTAARLVPGDVFVHEAFANALERTQERTLLPGAIAEYRRALECAPHRAINDLAIGRCLFLLGKFAPASEFFKQARRIEPTYWECDLWISRCQAAMGRLGAAQWTLRNLKARRDAYLTQREKWRLDFPSQNVPAPYDTAIVRYNEHIVDVELAKYASTSVK